MSVSTLSDTVRGLLRAPAHSVLLTLVLALAATAVASVYGIARAVVLQPLPFPDQHELVRIRESLPPHFSNFQVATGRFLYWQENAHRFAAMAMYRLQEQNLAPVSGDAQPVRVHSAEVTDAFFTTLGVRPKLGHGFDALGHDIDVATVVLSNGFWRRHFDADPDVLGRAIDLDGIQHRIVGVLPAGVEFPSSQTEVYTGWRTGAEEAQNFAGLRAHVLARLAAGVDLDSAQAELTALQQRLGEEHPRRGEWQVEVRELHPDLFADAGGRVAILAVVSILLLIIAISSAAGLSLVRISGRRPDLALRRALGATPSHLVGIELRQLVLLGLVAGAIGTVLAAAALAAIRATAPEHLPRIDAAVLDAGVVAIALTSAVLANLLAGLPALLLTASADAGPRADARVGSGGERTRRGLVIGKIAVALVLLTTASALLLNAQRLGQIDPGFAAANRYYIALSAAPTRQPEPYDLERLYRRVVDAAADLPEVEDAAVTQSLPLLRHYSLLVDVDDAVMDPEQRRSTQHYAVSPGYHDGMAIPLLRGRLLHADDHADAPPVALVSASFARTHLADSEPLGRRIRLVNDPRWREIVGVVGDVQQRGLDGEPGPQTYAPFAQQPFRHVYLLIASRVESGALQSRLAEAIAQVDATLALDPPRSLQVVVDQALAPSRFLSNLVGSIAAVALLLALLGLYGTLAFAVQRQRRELGVRMALGASGSVILAWMLGNGLRLAVLGVAIGLAFVFAGTTVFDSMANDLPTLSPAALATCAGLILGLGVLASVLPALHASRLDPARILGSS